jgi:cell shape-determining protein MreC
MVRLQFNQFFFFLLGLSFLSAFVFPPRWTDPIRGQLEGIFVPISRPSYICAIWLQERISPPQPSTRPADELEAENQELRQQITSDQIEIQRLSADAAEQANMGDLKKLCQRFMVAGADTSGRDGLILSGTSLGELKQSQPVFDDRRAIIGRIERAGLNSAYVRLITDVGFSVNAKFYRVTVNGTDPIVSAGIGKDLHPRVVGRGHGLISIANITMQQTQESHLAPGDQVVIDDNSWPQPAQSRLLGQVVSIKPSMMASGFAEISLATDSAIPQLNNVWVLTQDSQALQ